MSSWTYISGMVTVIPPGCGQHAMTFVLNEVLDHLPLVPGSEGPMTWHVVQRDGYSSWCNLDEFGMRSNLDRHGRYGFETQDRYFVLLEGCLRDTCYEDTLREFVKWLNRLSKRVLIVDMLVRVSGLKRCYGWGERIFSGAGYWKKNYRLAVESKDDLGLGSRKSTNFRYDLMPETEFWPDILVNLVPGGKKLAHDWDLILGNAEIEEYLEYDYKTDTYGDLSSDIFKLLSDANCAIRNRDEMFREHIFKELSKGGDES